MWPAAQSSTAIRGHCPDLIEAADTHLLNLSDRIAWLTVADHVVLAGTLWVDVGRTHGVEKVIDDVLGVSGRNCFIITKDHYLGRDPRPVCANCYRCRQDEIPVH